MRYSDLAKVIEAQWIGPLVATLVKKDIRVDPKAPAVEALRFALEWLDNPSLDLSKVTDELRMQAMLKMAAIHQRARTDHRKLDPEDAALGLDGAARMLLRVNIEGMLRDALH